MNISRVKAGSELKKKKTPDSGAKMLLLTRSSTAWGSTTTCVSISTFVPVKQALLY